MAEPSNEVSFRLIEINQTRYFRDAPAAKVAVISSDEEDWLWMTKLDIKKNIKQFGEHPELLKALAAYP